MPVHNEPVLPAMHFKVAQVCGQRGEVEACKFIIVKLIQEPCKLVWKHRKDRAIAQFASVPVHDYPMIKGIIASIMAIATHQGVHRTLNKKRRNQRIMNLMLK